MPRRSRRLRWTDCVHLLLEARQLLSGMVTETATYTATVPNQTTDFTQAIAIPQFSPGLGTLQSVTVTEDAGGNVSGTVTNQGTSSATFSISEAINVGLYQGTTALLGPALNASQTFTDLAGGDSGPFNPPPLTDSATTTYTSGDTFTNFIGSGDANLFIQTNTVQTTTGSGNIGSNLTTTAGATTTVTYTYTVDTVSVSGNVYEDVNGTGSLVPGDPPIPGTFLSLIQDVTGRIVAATTTGADGSYSFTSGIGGTPLFAGVYSVVEKQPDGFLQGTNTVGTVNGVTVGNLPGTDIIGSIALFPGQDSINNNFGEVLPVGLTGNVYEDANGTGALAAGDPPIPGVVLRLFDSTGLVAVTSTNAAGAYAFTTDASGAPLAPGDYTIVETQPAGFLQGTNTVGTVNGVTVGNLPGTDVIGSIVLHSGQDSLNNNFGEVLPVALEGTVYDDVNNTGHLSPGDLPIPGVVLRLFNPGGLVASTTTDAFGNYTFTTTASGAPLPPATYTIVETQPAGFLQGTNTVGTVNGVTVGNLPGTDVIGSIALRSRQVTLNNNFGELTPPPVIVPLHLTNVQRFGVHLQPTLVVLSFDTPLDPTTAQDVSHYQVFGPTDSKHPANIPVLSATYNAATNLVTLRLAERLDVHHPYRLTVTGLVNTTGGQLVGSNGVEGSPYVATLSRSALSGFTDIYGNFIPINHGQLYPAAIASGYHLKPYVVPANLGSFASTTKATYLAATAGHPQPAPITLRHGKKATSTARHR